MIKFIKKLVRFFTHREVLEIICPTFMAFYIVSLCCVTLFPFWVKVFILAPIALIVTLVVFWAVGGTFLSFIDLCIKLYKNAIRIWKEL